MIKSFKGKIPNNYNIYSNINENNIKADNKDLLKKLNDKYSINNKSSNLENQYNNYQKSNSRDFNIENEDNNEISNKDKQKYEKYIKPFNSIGKSLKKRMKNKN